MSCLSVFDFYGSKKYIHFSITGYDQYERFLKNLKFHVHQKNSLRKMMFKYKLDVFAHIDKYSTKLMCEELAKYINSQFMFEYTKFILDRYQSDRKQYHEEFVDLIILINFQKFIKHTRGGFNIYHKYGD